MTPTTEEQRAELLPCPICGTHLVGDGDSESNFYQHPRGECFFSEWEFDCMDIAAWNRRSPPPVAEGWRPIETAPKDGTMIMLSNGSVVAQGFWLHDEPYVREHRDLDGRWESDGHDDWMDYSGGMPTHWMPLPPPPALTKAGKKGEENG